MSDTWTHSKVIVKVRYAVIKRLMVNYDTPTHCLNFMWTYLSYSTLFGVTWRSNLGCSTFGQRILSVIRNCQAVPYGACLDGDKSDKKSQVYEFLISYCYVVIYFICVRFRQQCLVTWVVVRWMKLCVAFCSTCSTRSSHCSSVCSVAMASEHLAHPPCFQLFSVRFAVLY